MQDVLVGACKRRKVRYTPTSKGLHTDKDTSTTSKTGSKGFLRRTMYRVLKSNQGFIVAAGEGPKGNHVGKEAFEMDSESQIWVWQAETGGIRKLRCSKKGLNRDNGARDVPVRLAVGFGLFRAHARESYTGQGLRVILVRGLG